MLLFQEKSWSLKTGALPITIRPISYSKWPKEECSLLFCQSLFTIFSFKKGEISYFFLRHLAALLDPSGHNHQKIFNSSALKNITKSSINHYWYHAQIIHHCNYTFIFFRHEFCDLLSMMIQESVLQFHLVVNQQMIHSIIISLNIFRIILYFLSTRSFAVRV